ncbi:unnamed protein product, partial [Ceratitis capitata]
LYASTRSVAVRAAQSTNELILGARLTSSLYECDLVIGAAAASVVCAVVDTAVIDIAAPP